MTYGILSVTSTHIDPLDCSLPFDFDAHDDGSFYVRLDAADDCGDAIRVFADGGGFFLHYPRLPFTVSEWRNFIATCPTHAIHDAAEHPALPEEVAREALTWEATDEAGGWGYSLRWGPLDNQRLSPELLYDLSLDADVEVAEGTRRLLLAKANNVTS